ncbi:MAG: hypothetical protein II375_01455 [Bacteroidales bacterium]|nr:hypothetical protein [Bacteroidales bacterium]
MEEIEIFLARGSQEGGERIGALGDIFNQVGWRATTCGDGRNEAVDCSLNLLAVWLFGCPFGEGVEPAPPFAPQFS